MNFLLFSLCATGGFGFFLGRGADAAEMQIPDGFSVNGYSEFRSSVGVINFNAQTPYSLVVGTGAAYTLVVSTTGSVGIGTARPGAMLDVNGAASLAGDLKIGSGTAVCTADIAGTIRWTDGHLYVCNGSDWRQLDNQSPPLVTSINPSSGIAGATITIKGAGFVSGATVKIGDASATGVTFIAASQLKATAPAGSTAEAKDVTVTNPDGQFSILAGCFTYKIFATGGTIAEIGGYRIHTFTTSGAFTVATGGNVDYLVVAGGGGGGSAWAGGGGGGGFRTATGFAVTAQAYAVTVGGGGAGGTGGGDGTNGEDSVFSSIISKGGGGGAGVTGARKGKDGGSGGGAEESFAGGNGTSGQGNNGGQGNPGGGVTASGGGGGGAGSVGGTSTTASVAGNGGAGAASSISGSNLIYAGGGGGATGSTNNGGGVGTDGGGSQGAPGTNGTANTGSGGGAGRYDGSSYYNGGSGIVIIRYPL